jgi:hypothetical protein
MGLRRWFGAWACATTALLVHCKEPTQILVEVRADDCNGLRDTGIAVGTDTNDVENREISSYTGYDGCNKPGLIGTLYISPTGDKNEHVAFKVYTGVGTSAAQCPEVHGAGCIEQTRETEFIAGATHHVIVTVSKKCLSAICPIGTTCVEGACYKVGDVTPTGDTVDDAGASEAGFNEGGPNPPPPPPPPPPDAGDAGGPCTGCKGNCNPTATPPKCDVTCGGLVNCNGSVCAPNIDCHVTCARQDECKGLQCNTSGSCVIDCNAVLPIVQRSCNGVSCKTGQSCIINCNADNSCTGDTRIALDAGSNATLNCGNKGCGDNGQGKAVCKAVTTCGLNCNGQGCPNDAKCCAAQCMGQWSTNGPNGCN